MGVGVMKVVVFWSCFCFGLLICFFFILCEHASESIVSRAHNWPRGNVLQRHWRVGMAAHDIYRQSCTQIHCVDRYT